jgi:splicing factor 3B subunit 3
MSCRSDLPVDRTVLITCFASFKNKKFGFFFLLLSEFGDLYKLNLNYSSDTGKVDNMKISLFETIPASVSICIIKTGYLFAACEFGNHLLFKFIGLGENNSPVVSSSSTIKNQQISFKPTFFSENNLNNLEQVDEILSLSPIIDMKVENVLDEEVPQIFLACGHGCRSSLRLLRLGTPVTESVCADLPDCPTFVFSLRASRQDLIDRYIVISYDSATMVLVISDGVVNQTTCTGLQTDVSTLQVQLMSDSSIVQAHTRGLRHILPDNRIHEWSAPVKKSIVKVACNTEQIVLAMNDGEIIYLELEQQSQRLSEIAKKDMNVDISAIDICPIPEGAIKALFFAVASHDSTVRIFSLNLNSVFRQVSVQYIEAAFADSIAYLDSKKITSSNDFSQIENNTNPLFLQIGLSSGVLMRVEMDRLTGELRDARWRFIGLQAPQLVPVIAHGRQAIVAISNRLWIGYMESGKYLLNPLCYCTVNWLAPFATEEAADGFVAVTGTKKGSSG